MAEDKKGKTSTNPEENRKVNPWIPVAIVAVIVALLAVMALLANNSSNTSTTSTDTAASGTTQSGTSGTTAGTDVDVSWITLDITPNDVATKTGIKPAMLQQVIGVTAAQMAQPFKDIGGQTVLDKAASLVVQFGGQGSSMGAGGTTGGSTSAPSGMGGTTTP
jgi:hypothetical protein